MTEPDWATKQREAAAQRQLDMETMRQELRKKLVIAGITDSAPQLYQAEFDGYGDSGNFHGGSGNDEVDTFLSKCVDMYVTFDWYNNDGGGGDITWDVLNDKIIINGYYNQTVRTDVMEEEVF